VQGGTAVAVAALRAWDDGRAAAHELLEPGRACCDACPRGMQRLLSSASWDADRVLRDVRDCVVSRLGEPGGILVIDETGDLKKGAATVGVQRQYTGTAGRIESSQVAVYLTYACGQSDKGHTLMDRALYLPKSWTGDVQRMAAAGVPAEVGFATKPALAQAMISDALDAGVPASWVAADEVDGADFKLRRHLRQAGLGYVLAVAKNHPITTGIGPRAAIDLARPGCRNVRGSGFRPGVAARVNAGTIGHWSTPSTRQPTRQQTRR
jgi:SRSO17 transposase